MRSKQTQRGSNTRISNDAHGREGLRKKLVMCIDSLDRGKHPNDIVNIVSGRLARHQSMHTTLLKSEEFKCMNFKVRRFLRHNTEENNNRGSEKATCAG